MPAPEPRDPATPRDDAPGSEGARPTPPGRLGRAVLGGLQGIAARLELRVRRRETLEPYGELPLPPLFVGGTGRSGTTVLGRILGADRGYHMIRFEIRFLTDPGGLIDLVDGRVGFGEFAWRLQHRWNPARPRTPGGRLVTPERQRAALAELGASLRADRTAAARRFVHRILDASAAEAGARGWIEMTPGNAHVAPVLAAWWPASKLVHTVRDGRDVACSVTPLGWGPDTLDGALRWWAARLEEAFTACASAPAGYAHTVRMESLLGTDRDAELARLLAFAGLAETPPVRRFFDERATTARANLGRWRADVPADQLDAFLALHESLATGLVARGWPYVPYEAPVELPVAVGG